MTGTLGDSAAGLRRLRRGRAARTTRWSRAHLRPRPPLALGRRAARLGVRCAIDVSDGLLQDLGHVCELSGLGAVVRAAGVPVSRAAARRLPGRRAGLACTGGEDYELLLVAPGEQIEQVRRSSDVPLTVIGEMVERPGARVRAARRDRARRYGCAPAGWDHLREAAERT